MSRVRAPLVRVFPIAMVAILAITLGAAAPAAADAPRVSAAASAGLAGAIEVSWSPVDGAIGYVVAPQRLTSSGEWTAVPGRAERFTTVRPAVFDELINGTSYRACVAAVLPTGFAVAVSDPAIPYGLPGTPTIGEVTRAGDELTVVWSPAAANGRQITAYTVVATPVDAASGSSATVELIVGGNETTILIEGLDEDADYTITIRATNLRGQGEIASTAAPAVVPMAFVPDDATSMSAGATGSDDVRLVADAGPCAGAATSPAPPSPAPTPPAPTPTPPDVSAAGSDTADEPSDSSPAGRTPSSRPSDVATGRADDGDRSEASDVLESQPADASIGAESPDPGEQLEVDEDAEDVLAVNVPPDPDVTRRAAPLLLLAMMVAGVLVSVVVLQRRRTAPQGQGPEHLQAP